jgi:hypothetical protein
LQGEPLVVHRDDGKQPQHQCARLIPMRVADGKKAAVLSELPEFLACHQPVERNEYLSIRDKRFAGLSLNTVPSERYSAGLLRSLLAPDLLAGRVPH